METSNEKRIERRAIRAYARRFPLEWDALKGFTGLEWHPWHNITALNQNWHGEIRRDSGVDYLILRSVSGVLAVYRISKNGERIEYVKPAKHPEGLRAASVPVPFAVCLH